MSHAVLTVSAKVEFTRRASRREGFDGSTRPEPAGARLPDHPRGHRASSVLLLLPHASAIQHVKMTTPTGATWLMTMNDTQARRRGALHCELPCATASGAIPRLTDA